MKIIILLFMCGTLQAITNEAYTKVYAKGFNIPLPFIYNFSFAESTHNSNNISVSNAIGRFQIREVLLKHYCKLTEQPFENIKDVRSFLLNDKNNTYIFCYMVAHWRREGWNLKEISQIWLFGKGGFLSGRYSTSFENKIFKRETK